MKKWLLPILLLVLVLCLATHGYLYFTGHRYMPWDNADDNACENSGATSKLRYLSECVWISTSIASDIADLIQFAKSKEKSPLQIRTSIVDNNQLAISYSKPGWRSFFPTKITQTISASIWSPELYLPVAESLLKSAGLPTPAPTTASSGNALETQLNPQVEVLEKENQRLSEWLSKEPLNATAHEEAALLCGSLALREAASCFYDARPALNQLTAHLALAQALRGQAAASDAGTMARIIQEVVSGRQVYADDLLKKWSATATDNPTKTAWAKALTLRNTGNWTALTTPGAEPLLVRLEYLRATADQVSNAMALEFWKHDDTLQHMPDMVRLGFKTHASVGEGHLFTRIGLALEMTEIKHLFEAQKKTFATGSLPAFVNAVPGTPVCTADDGTTQLRVITPGAWGRFYQRHILHDALAIYYHIDKSWGVPEKAVQFKNSLTPILSTFTYYPVLQFRWTEKPEFKSQQATLDKFITENIEYLTDYNAIMLSRATPEWGSLLTAWFTPYEPIGTTYAGEFRAYSGHYADGVEGYYKLHPLLPNIALGHFRNELRHQKANLEMIKDCFGPLLDYNLWSMISAANAVKENPEQYEAIYSKICALDPDYYMELGNYYVIRKMPEKAAEVYQKGLDLGQNNVLLANNCEWLVNYYYDNGRKDDALKIASLAAKVYSYAGLQTMMNLQDKMGNATEAEDYGKKILERYQDSSALQSLYIRHPELPGRAEFQKQLDEEVRKFYPDGLPRVTLASFKEPPADGIQLGGSERLRSLGINTDTVIVAVDGVQVHNEKQYVYVRGLNPSQKMDLIVWKNGRYEALTVEQPGRRFGVQIINYAK